MASRAQRRKRYLRRRAHAAQVPRYGRGDFHNVKFDPTLLPSVEHLAEDMIRFAEKYMLSAHRMEPWQERVIKDVVRSL